MMRVEENIKMKRGRWLDIEILTS